MRGVGRRIVGSRIVVVGIMLGKVFGRWFGWVDWRWGLLVVVVNEWLAGVFCGMGVLVMMYICV